MTLSVAGVTFLLPSGHGPPAVRTLPVMLPHQPAPYTLTRDTTCREGCPHYGHPAPPHSHFEQREPPVLAPRNGAVMRWLIRLYSSEWHWPRARHGR